VVTPGQRPRLKFGPHSAGGDRPPAMNMHAGLCGRTKRTFKRAVAEVQLAQLLHVEDAPEEHVWRARGAKGGAKGAVVSHGKEQHPFPGGVPGTQLRTLTRLRQ
jgi:hypothetical protein